MLIASIIIIINKNQQEGNVRKKIDGTYEVLPERDFGIEYKQEELRDPTEFFSVEVAIKKNIPDFNAERIQFLQGENISSAAATLTLKVESNVEWKVVSEKSWCVVPSENTWTGNAAVEVQVGENLTGESRSAVLEIVSTDGVLKEEIHVSQLAEVFSENHHYKLPVVFQVLYVNKSDKNQYVEEGHLI